MMFVPEYETTADAVIKVIGVGGGGGNALNHMVSDEIDGVEFFSVNTDAQVLRKSAVRQTIQIGANITKGLGAGANPNVGRQAAEEDRDALSNMIAGADMTFIAAGMGGGTGTGAAPVIAEIAKNQGSLTVAIVTKPFKFEGRKRMSYADQGIQELSKYVDSLIIIPNDKLLKVLGKNITMMAAFDAANDILRNAVLGITDMITSPGLINVDFADVRTVMSEMGRAMMGTGIAEGPMGEGRAEKAAQDAVASPLLEDVDLAGAKGILVSISSGIDLGLDEIDTIMDYIHSFAHEDATVVFGSSIYPEMEGKVRVTLVATGIGQAEDNLTIMPKVPPMQAVQSSQQNVNQASATNTYNMSQPSVQSGYNTGYNPAVNHFEQPTINRQQPAAQPQKVDEDKLFNIPSFIRNNHK